MASTSFSAISLIVILLVSEISAYSDGSRGGGGGGYVCLDPASKRSTFYSIDYFFMDPKYAHQHDFGNKSSCKSIVNDIYLHLQAINPPLAAGLSDFMTFADPKKWVAPANIPLFANGKIYPRVWIKVCGNDSETSCLGNIRDDEVAATPGQCRKVQIAERVQWNNPDVILTQVNEKAFAEIEKNPVQCSYFMLHEWMRDFIRDASEIRKLDQELHSDEFFTNNKFSISVPSDPAVAEGAQCLKMEGGASNLNVESGFFAYYKSRIMKNWKDPYEEQQTISDDDFVVNRQLWVGNASFEALPRVCTARLNAGALDCHVERDGDRYWVISAWKTWR